MADLFEYRICFTAKQFAIEPGEDSETNPLCYGRSLAEWLRSKVIAIGYPAVEEVIAEDWGWCVMCQRDPFWLLIGCVSIHDYHKTLPEDPAPHGNEVTWSCTVDAEVPLFRRLFGRRPETKTAVERLFSDVKSLLAAEPDVRFVECS